MKAGSTFTELLSRSAEKSVQHFGIDNDAANYRLVGAKVVEKADPTDSYTSVRACGNHDVMLT